MAMTESDIKIIIAAELKKKGFNDAEKATSKLDQGFKRLAGTIATVFGTQQIVRFGKQAMKAFADDEQAAIRFEQALKNVNLGFAAPAVENYLTNLEKQTGVLKDDLRPAYQSLAQTTRSLNMSQELLNTAIDVSAGSGVDLITVIRDLTRSYVGNNQGLIKYNLGLSRAELRTTSFEKVQKLLNEQFSGQRAAYLETYAGRLQLVNVAYDQMQETIGGALLDSFQMLAGDNGIEGATSAMERLGIVSADVIRGVGVAIAGVADRVPFFDKIFNVSNLPVIGAYIDMFRALGEPRRPLFFPGAGIGQPAIDRRNKILEEEAIKRQKELEKLRAKQLREQEKANRLKRISLMLMEKERKFNMTRIQLQAASQGKLTAEEAKRVQELMLIEDIKEAIAKQDVEEAEQLMDKLKSLQEETKKLANQLTSFPKANDPFTDWLKTLDKLQSALASILGMTSPKTLAIKSSASAGNAAMAQGDVYAAQGASLSAQAEALLAIDAANAAIAAATTPTELAAANEFLNAANGALDAAAAIADSAGALAVAAAAAELMASRDLFAESVASARAAGVAETQIIVNVEGSVIAAEDLAETITDMQYTFQKTGKGLLFSSVAI